MTIYDLHPTASREHAAEQIQTLIRRKSGEFSMSLKVEDGRTIEFKVSCFSYNIEKRDVVVCILREKQ